MPVLDDLASVTASVADRAGPAVVGVGAGWSQGSGLVTAEGMVATNAHNLRDGAVTVTFLGGRAAEARVQGVDPDGDLAVLAVDTGGVVPLEWSNLALRPGAGVVALANPGGRGLRATLGQVSALGQAFRGPRGRRVTGSIEHTAPLPKGSSGGPIVDTEGRVLGLNVHRLGEGFYLAIPADDELRGRLEQLAAGSSPRPVHLGVALAPSRVARRLRAAVGLPEQDGLLVRAVEPEGAAARAGLRVGDLVVAAGGGPVTSVDHLHAALDGVAAGGALTLGVVRGTDPIDLVVTFGPPRGPASTS